MHAPSKAGVWNVRDTQVLNTHTHMQHSRATRRAMRSMPLITLASSVIANHATRHPLPADLARIQCCKTYAARSAPQAHSESREATCGAIASVSRCNMPVQDKPKVRRGVTVHLGSGRYVSSPAGIAIGSRKRAVTALRAEQALRQCAAPPRCSPR